MEYIEGEELYYHIMDRKRLPEVEALSIMRQVVSAVHYLHRENICHRDIKPENIMIDKSGNAKLIDFGFVGLERKESQNYMQTFCGSLFYSPPEMLKKEPYIGHSCDIWSLGIVLHFMLDGNLPFPPTDIHGILSRMEKGIKIRSEHITKGKVSSFFNLN